MLLAWFASIIIYSAKVREFRYRRKLEILTEDQDKIIWLKTAALEKMNRELTDKVAEREVMLQEINHKVRNNLQIIVSLFNLSMDGDFQGTPEALITDNKNRVLSMASRNSIG